MLLDPPLSQKEISSGKWLLSDEWDESRSKGWEQGRFLMSCRSCDVRFCHKADILNGRATVPLSGVERTRPKIAVAAVPAKRSTHAMIALTKVRELNLSATTGNG